MVPSESSNPGASAVYGYALIAEHRLSQRRAGQTVGLARSSLRYAPVACDDSGVMDFIQRNVALNPRHGFGLLDASACYQEQPWGKTVLWHVYCQLKLNLPRWGKKRLPERIKQPLGQPTSRIWAGAVTSCPTPCGQADA